jgi:hypothetical protein
LRHSIAIGAWYHWEYDRYSSNLFVSKHFSEICNGIGTLYFSAISTATFVLYVYGYLNSASGFLNKRDVLRAAIVPQPITATLVFVMANSSYNTF